MSDEKNYAYPTSPTAPLSRLELTEIHAAMSGVCRAAADVFTPSERRTLYDMSISGVKADAPVRNEHALSRALLTLRTARIFAEMVEPDRNMLAAILLAPSVADGAVTLSQIAQRWGDDVASLVAGHQKVAEFTGRGTAVSGDNFRGLLIALARDIRIIIAMITESLATMRLINRHPDQAWVRNVAFEANCLYAQLAHRLGLYKIKGELEDLSLKYTNREIYTEIARRLNETKRGRDAYIAAFIAPVRQKLTEAGLKFSIKGRTKSISSIWAKIKKQKVDLAHIYDLFAIRVIIDTPREREKSDCWLAYSILADMYTANPARMKDWISIPKSNGYESLHATVMGPQNKWVEVQFRTVRMDLVAEKGLAAHWRYKGGHSDSTDQWMNNIRDILETAEAGPMQLMRSLRPDAYEKEVYAFSPKGDLLRLPIGATVLDFAFRIHSRVGCGCTGAIVNGRHEKISYKIKNGDTIEVVTSSTQTPKQDWLGIVVSPRARNKIRQALGEAKARQAELGRELLERRIKNRKLEIDEAHLARVIKKLGYKFNTDFFADIQGQTLDPARVIAMLQQLASAEAAEEAGQSAQEFQLHEEEKDEKTIGTNSEPLVIGGTDIRGLKYSLARCCTPVWGDAVFGFINASGEVKVHRNDCPNAAHIRQRYPYRLIDVQWSGSRAEMAPVSLRILGRDDIGIVTNITSIISKEPQAALRSISIDSHDGLFQGTLLLGVSSSAVLSSLLRKITAIKGVKQALKL